MPIRNWNYGDFIKNNETGQIYLILGGPMERTVPKFHILLRDYKGLTFTIDTFELKHCYKLVEGDELKTCKVLYGKS